MNRKKGILVLLVILAAVLAGASALYGNLSQQVDAGPAIQETNQNPVEENNAPAEEAAQEAELMPAPDFIVYNDAGEEVRLSDLRGKPVVVNFWASWCSPCKNEMPDFEEAFAEHGEEIHFMLVNMTDGDWETQEGAREYVASQGYTFPVYYDLAQDAAITYGVSSIPATYFIDADGNAIARAAGMLDRETLQMGIDMILPATAE